MTEHTEGHTGFEDLFFEHRFMRIPRELPSSAIREPEIGLTVLGNLLIFNDGSSKYYWQKALEGMPTREHIVASFKKKGAAIHRH